MSIPELSASDWAAWWGAAVATLVLFWDTIKSRRDRAAVRVDAQADMHLTGSEGLTEEKYVLVTVRNIGGRPLTITHLIIIHYSGWVRRLLRRPSMQGAILNPLPGLLPHVLAPGEVWTGLADQDDLNSKVSSGGHLLYGIHHPLSKRPVMVRVKGL